MCGVFNDAEMSLVRCVPVDVPIGYYLQSPTDDMRVSIAAMWSVTFSCHQRNEGAGGDGGGKQFTVLEQIHCGVAVVLTVV